MSANKEGLIVMNERKIKILYSIIQDFICTGEPVGSRTLSKKYNLGVSSATIRNEMSDLEELGFLEQVHTSSGRRPSNKGYRLYVDKLMRPMKISIEEEKSLKSNLVNIDLFDIEDILRSKLTLISELTNLACILKIPPVAKSSIQSIQFIKINIYNLLAVIITNEGIIRNHIIKLNKDIDQNDIYLISKIINEYYMCRSYDEIDLDLIFEVASYLNLDGCLVDQLVVILRNLFIYNEEGDYYLEGINNILSYPEFNDIDKARDLLHFLDNISKFDSLLNCSQDVSVEIKIGDENVIEEAKNYSIVLGNCKRDDRIIGTIGIIGPTRMDYAKIVSILKILIDFINSNIY